MMIQLFLLLLVISPVSTMKKLEKIASFRQHKTKSVRSSCELCQQAHTYGLENKDVHFKYYGTLTDKIQENANKVANYENAPNFDGLKCKGHEIAENALIMAVAYQDVLLSIYLPLLALKKYYKGDYEQYKMQLSNYKNLEQMPFDKKIPFDKLDEHFNHMNEFLTNFKTLENYIGELETSINAIEHDWQVVERAEKGRITLADYFVDIKKRGKNEKNEYTFHFLRIFKERYHQYIENAKSKIRHSRDPNALNTIESTSGGQSSSNLGAFSRQSSNASEFEKLPKIKFYANPIFAESSGKALAEEANSRMANLQINPEHNSIRKNAEPSPVLTKSGSIRDGKGKEPVISSIRDLKESAKTDSIRGNKSPQKSTSIRSNASIRGRESPHKTSSIREISTHKSVKGEQTNGDIQPTASNPPKVNSIRDISPAASNTSKPSSIRDIQPRVEHPKPSSIRDSNNPDSIRDLGKATPKNGNESIRSNQSSIFGGNESIQNKGGYESDSSMRSTATSIRKKPKGPTADGTAGSSGGSIRKKPKFEFEMQENACIIQLEDGLQFRNGDIVWEIVFATKEIFFQNGDDGEDVTAEYQPITNQDLQKWMKMIPDSGKKEWKVPENSVQTMGKDYVKYTKGEIAWEVTNTGEIWFKRGNNAPVELTEFYEPLTPNILQEFGLVVQ